MQSMLERPLKQQTKINKQNSPSGNMSNLQKSNMAAKILSKNFFCQFDMCKLLLGMKKSFKRLLYFSTWAIS